MTLKQKQALLAYLGCYTVAIDDIWRSGEYSVSLQSGWECLYAGSVCRQLESCVGMRKATILFIDLLIIEHYRNYNINNAK